ncbi:hypothetical protein [Bacillus thuringiensis]|uniref:hypothetical protein n=1 Tax=Bacillus thuringiensis TaxID=1428 RepID=UPI000BFD9018|nr:hypothetical protein [Bacillus thuringiensis]PGT90084.1 hypothetical protein COD17_10060 [Bacillus thuringiensis]
MVEKAKKLVKQKEEKLLQEIDRLLEIAGLPAVYQQHLQKLRNQFVVYVYIANTENGENLANARALVGVSIVKVGSVSEDTSLSFRKQFGEIDLLFTAIRDTGFPAGTIGYARVEKLLEEENDLITNGK